MGWGGLILSPSPWALCSPPKFWGVARGAASGETYICGFGFCPIAVWVSKRGELPKRMQTSREGRVSPLRKDLRSGRPQAPSGGGSCPSSSTPSGRDFPGFSFGFWGHSAGCGAELGPAGGSGEDPP